MHASLLTAATVALAALGASAAPARRSVDPLPFNDGFPTPDAAQLAQIELDAHGTLSNSTPPATISSQGITNLRLIEFNELIESVFFEQLLYNVTSGVAGFELPSWVDYNYFVSFLQVTLNVEELHNVNAANALKHFNATGIEPCTSFNFPVSNFEEAILFASTITSNVYGTLGDIILLFAQNGDAGLTRGIASALANEGEQNGFFRYLLGRVPDELPFTTFGNVNFSFTALQSFVDPSSCPNLNLLSDVLTTFETVSFIDTPTGMDQNVRLALSKTGYVNGTSYNVVYSNQQNVPVVVPATFVSEDDTTVVISALFPFTEHLLNGLTIASVTDQAGPFATIDAAAAAAIWAPAFALVN